MQDGTVSEETNLDRLKDNNGLKNKSSLIHNERNEDDDQVMSEVYKSDHQVEKGENQTKESLSDDESSLFDGVEKQTVEGANDDETTTKVLTKDQNQEMEDTHDSEEMFEEIDDPAPTQGATIE